MRLGMAGFSAACCAALLTGCIQDFATDDKLVDAATVVDSTGSITTADAGDDTVDSGDDGSPANSADETQRWNASGQVSDGNRYRLFDLGDGWFADEWTVDVSGTSAGPFVVVLFDEQMNLLSRGFLSARGRMTHILRAHTPRVRLGVMIPSSGGGGSFSMVASRREGASVPAPNAALVWLNFSGASGVEIHGRDPVSFPAFDASMLGGAYAGQTVAMRAAIVQAMREDYASFAVTLVSSDESTEPTEPHATLHFGSDAPGLLGLADRVDAYNRRADEAAIIYANNFAIYETMQLSADEMAVMVANVASHELGHLLGLYHTQTVTDVMDTTGSAWDLAANQDFQRGELEATVFAVGMEDSPALLAYGVGLSGVKAGSTGKWSHGIEFDRARAIAQSEIPHTCGTCLHLDE